MHRKHARLPWRRIALSIFTALALAAGALSFSLNSATADPQLSPLELAQAQKANCQLLVVRATSSAQRTRAQQCVTDQTRIIQVLTATTSPTPSASPTATPTVPPTTTPAPTTVPPTTTTPPATTPPVTTVPPTTPPATTVPPTTPPPSTGFPDATNTGVPPGTVLTAYTGPCTITATNTVIDSKTLNCDLEIQATGVTIRNSVINGTVHTNEGVQWSFSLTDSEVHAGLIQEAAVGTTNMQLLRVEVTGGTTSLYCFADCLIRDSWLHAQEIKPGSDWHVGAFLANDDGEGGGTNATLIHNTIHCSVAPTSADGGCSGDINLYGDFGPIRGVTIDGNLMRANTGISYCVYGGESPTKPFPHATGVKITNNVIERGTNGKCGAFGPVTAFNPAGAGNVWSNNTWSDGGLVPSEN